MTHSNIPAGTTDPADQEEPKMKACTACTEYEGDEYCTECKNTRLVEMTPDDLREEIETKKENQISDQL